MPDHTKSERRKRAAFREVNRNEPAIVKKTRRKKGKAAAKRQNVAIALSKSGGAK